jgi:hypothetical protein
MGDIERFFELKEVANRGLISRRYPTVVSAGLFFVSSTTFALTAA